MSTVLVRKTKYFPEAFIKAHLHFRIASCVHTFGQVSRIPGDINKGSSW